MAEVSNEALALLMVAVLVVTIGAVVSISWLEGGVTGADTGIGEVSVNVPASISIVVVQNVSFGNGTVTSACTLSSNDTSKPSCWDNSTAYNPTDFLVNNQGNRAMNVTIQSNNTAAGFIGGTSPAYKYSYISCTAGCTALDTAGWHEFTAADTEYGLVNWSAGNYNQNMTVGIQVTIPTDTYGDKKSTVTFTSTAI